MTAYHVPGAGHSGIGVDGETGLPVPIKDPAALAYLITRLTHSS
jgi:hypothetical protein